MSGKVEVLLFRGCMHRYYPENPCQPIASERSIPGRCPMCHPERDFRPFEPAGPEGTDYVTQAALAQTEKQIEGRVKELSEGLRVARELMDKVDYHVYSQDQIFIRQIDRLGERLEKLEHQEDAKSNPADMGDIPNASSMRGLVYPPSPIPEPPAERTYEHFHAWLTARGDRLSTLQSNRASYLIAGLIGCGLRGRSWPRQTGFTWLLMRLLLWETGYPPTTENTNAALRDPEGFLSAAQGGGYKATQTRQCLQKIADMFPPRERLSPFELARLLLTVEAHCREAREKGWIETELPF